MIYISGKISDPDPASRRKNIERFEVAAFDLSCKGLEYFNPAKLDGQFDWTYEEYLAYELQFILENRPDMYMLRGWQDSLGARLEHALADRLCLTIEYQKLSTG